MSQKKLFGTDGIRGLAGKYPLDSKTVQKIGFAAGYILGSSKNSKFIVGMDTRKSGTKIASLLSKALCAYGANVWSVGVVPTPAVAFLVKKNKAQAGVVISASHNPYKDNGIKFFGPDGKKLSDEKEAQIEKLIFDNTPTINKKNKGKIVNKKSIVEQYIEFILKTAKNKIKTTGKLIVIDCAHGAASKIAPVIFKKLGFKVVALNATPNGVNINKNCGALHPQNLAKEVLKHKAHCGFAFDGDSDRVIAVDEKGIVRDGDHIIAVLANNLKQMGKLSNNIVVATVMANLGFMKAMRKAGIKVISAKVGDRYVREAMDSSGAVLGGEQSGHFILSEYLSTGDGILSALQILVALSLSSKTFSELCSLVEKYPQVLLNVPVAKRVPLEKLVDTALAIENVNKQLKGDGRVLVRYSGTENLLRVMIEGKEENIINNFAQNIAQVALKEIAGYKN